jgi:dihydroorotate dehydrogenase electron transfer subunit
MSIVYKVVGVGTKALSQTPPGAECGVMAPLGNSFSVPEKEEIPVIVAGGYGSAATDILAKRSPTPGKLLLGARSEKDVIISERFEGIGFRVEISTDAGSLGKKGLVTELLEPYLEQAARGGKLRFYGCGPNPMLMAMAETLENAGLDGELSLDQMMCCGVGACFACVEKIKSPSYEDGWRYARTCSEGPIFKASEIHRD